MKINKCQVLCLFNKCFIFCAIFSLAISHVNAQQDNLIDNSRLFAKQSWFSDLQESNFLSTYMPNEILNQLKHLPLPSETYSDVTIIQHNSEFYALIPCHLDVFKWNGIAWQNLYRYDNKGYNCGSLPFFYENDFFLFGGSGFWRGHADLLKFNHLLGSWGFEKTKNQPDNLKANVLGHLDNHLFYLFTTYYNERSQSNYIDQSVSSYMYDLSNREWLGLSFESILSTTVNQGNAKYLFEPDNLWVDVQDFILFDVIKSDDKTRGVLIFDKRNFTFHFNSVFMSKFELDAKWELINGNFIHYQDAQNNVVTIDVQFLHRNAINVGNAKIVPLNKEFSMFDKQIVGLNLYQTLGVIFLIILLSSSMAILIYKRYQRLILNDSNHSSEELRKDVLINDLIGELQLKCGQSLTVEELDEIIGTSSIPNNDSRKARRAKLINEINFISEDKYGIKMIERQRNKVDKRLMLYYIFDLDARTNA